MPIDHYTMHPVTSSNIESVGYNPEEKTMYVSFLNGSTYQYLEVPEEEFLNTLNAPSVGKYLNSNIKPMYTAERI